jgi:CheY-like chemotaxis protein
MNLVINGAEAMGDARGSVRVSTGVTAIDAEAASRFVVPPRDADARHVFVEVRDSGSGMDEETQAKIFDPFFTTKFTGRGLGLAAVLGIVRAHAGALSVESALGAGTTFRVLFPAAGGLPEAREEPSADSFRARGRVLVVDDDAGVRTAYRRLLAQFGLEVIEAQDGRRGVEALAQHQGAIAAVLLDMTMPDMNGEETLLELRRVDARVPVILASGYTDVEASERFAGSDIVAFLAKPFSANELVRCLRAAGL